MRFCFRFRSGWHQLPGCTVARCFQMLWTSSSRLDCCAYSSTWPWCCESFEKHSICVLESHPIRCNLLALHSSQFHPICVSKCCFLRKCVIKTTRFLFRLLSEWIQDYTDIFLSILVSHFVNSWTSVNQFQSSRSRASSRGTHSQMLTWLYLSMSWTIKLCISLVIKTQHFCDHLAHSKFFKNVLHLVMRLNDLPFSYHL